MRVVLDLRGEFGTRRARSLRLTEDGIWKTRVGHAHVRWSGAPQAERHDDDAHSLQLKLNDPDRVWQETEACWRERIPRLEDRSPFVTHAMPTRCSPA